MSERFPRCHLLGPKANHGVLLLHEHYALTLCAERKVLVAFCELIARSMHSSVLHISFASLFLSSDFVHVAIRLISTLISHIFGHIEHVDLSKIVDVRAVTSFVTVLDLFSGCSTDKWTLLRDNAPVASILETLCIKMCTPCATQANILALQKIIAAGLKGTRQPLTDQSIDELFRVIVRFMGAANFDADEECATFFQLLRAPTVTMALSKNTLHMVKAQRLFSKCILWLSSAQNQAALLSLGTNETLHLVANLIHLGNTDRETITENLLEWARLVNILLQKCIQKSGKQRPTNCWHHPLLGWTSERVDERDQVSFVRLRVQLSRLWSCDMVRCLSGQFLSRCGSVSASASFPLVQTTAAVAEHRPKKPSKSATVWKRRQSSAQEDADTNGTSSSSTNSSLPLFQSVPWTRRYPRASNICGQFLNEQRRQDNGCAAGGSDDVRLRTYLGYLVSDTDVLAPHFAPLQLFADITFTLISILDEREMYECDRPFRRDQLRQIAKFVNHFCFQALWNELIDFEKNLPSKLFNSVYRLLQILYNRDCRRPFTGMPNFWTVDELSPRVLIAEFERGTGVGMGGTSLSPSQRAHTLMDKMPHVIPLRDRIVLFRKLIGQDKENLEMSTTIITVERSRLIEDAVVRRQMDTVRDNAPVASILETLCIKMCTPCATQANILALQKIIAAGLKGTRQPLTDQSIDELFRVIVRFMRAANYDADEECATFFQLLRAPTVTMALSKNTLHMVKAQRLFSKCILWLSSAQNQAALLSLGTNETLHLVANLIHLGNTDREVRTKCRLYVFESSCPVYGAATWSGACPANSFPDATTTAAAEHCPKKPSKSAAVWKRRQSSAQEDADTNGTSSSSTNSSLPLFQMFLRKLPTRTSCSASAGEDGIMRKTHHERHSKSNSSSNNGNASINIPRVPFPPIAPTVVLCQLYRSALLAFPNSESEILASLGRDDTLVLQHLWQFLNEQRRQDNGCAAGGSDDVRLRTYLGYLVSDTDVLAPHFAPLQLFADITFTLIS
uniref:HECT-type E3 ubiquitin transferase n=1 Tax=Globodera pallida TaxID=36090 RepID=A0A183CBV0_GLOPA